MIKHLISFVLAMGTWYIMPAQTTDKITQVKFAALPKFVWSNGEDEFMELRDYFTFRLDNDQLVIFKRVSKLGSSGTNGYEGYNVCLVKRNETNPEKGKDLVIPQIPNGLLMPMDGPLSFIQVNGKIFCIVQHLEKIDKEMKLFLYACAFDTEKLELEKSKSPFYIANPRKMFVEVEIQVSENHDFFIVKEDIRSTQAAENQVKITAFDHNISKINEFELSKPTGVKAYRVLDYVVKDKNNAAVLVNYILAGENDKDKKSTGLHPLVLHCYQEGKDVMSVLMNNAVDIHEGRINWANAGTVAVAIRCADKTGKAKYYFDDVKAGQVFNGELKELGLGESLNQTKSVSGTPIATVLKKIYAFNDGLYAVVFEQEGNDPYKLLSPSNKFNLVVAGIQKDGTLAWQVTVPKNNTETDIGLGLGTQLSPNSYTSYIGEVQKNHLWFMFAENTGNAKDKSENQAGAKNSAPVLVSIDEKGQMTKEWMAVPQGKKSIQLWPEIVVHEKDKWMLIENDDENNWFFYETVLK